MLFCNRPIDVTHPAIVDIAPTVLDLFGVPVPPHLDGKPFMTGRPRRTAAQANPTPRASEVPQSA
jgi:arylsulfatase A-like enzyme